MQQRQAGTSLREGARTRHLFFSFPLGSTVVVGGTGRSETETGDDSAGRGASFFGFFAILLLRCSPLATGFPL
jgi:hypothetical protein